MSILVLTTAIFFTTTMVLMPLFFVLRETCKKIKLELEKSKKDFEDLTKKLDVFKDELSTKRIGYYQDKVTLLSQEDKENGLPGDIYTFSVYIKELDRYTNGLSKIQLTNFELISGYD